jgi:GcrA cell cycle regulator
MMYPHGSTAWTDERVELLRKCVADGLSAGQAGRKLSCTRCAAIGKARRLGLTFGLGTASTPARLPPKPPKPVKLAAMSWGAGKSSPFPVPATPYVERLGEAGTVTMLDLGAHHCRFPVGDPQAESFRFCGGAKLETSSYCARHHAICTTKAPPPRPKADADAPRRRRAA